MRFDSNQRMAIGEARAVAKAAEAQKEKTHSSAKAIAEPSAKLPRQHRKVGLTMVTIDTWKKKCDDWATVADK